MYCCIDLFRLDFSLPYYFNRNGILCRDDSEDEEEIDSPRKLIIPPGQYNTIMSSIQHVIEYRMLKLYDIECKSVAPSHVPVYITPNWRNAEKMLLVIQSSGKLKPGIWSRSLIIEGGGLKNGSMLPVFHRASQKNYAIVVLNPNSCWLPDYRYCYNSNQHIHYIFCTNVKIKF